MATTKGETYGDGWWKDWDPDAPMITECNGCHETKPVCCDSGYTIHPDGSSTHEDAFCAACCPNRDAHRQPPRRGERMDCDQ